MWVWQGPTSSWGSLSFSCYHQWSVTGMITVPSCFLSFHTFSPLKCIEVRVVCREGVSRGESICHDCENDLYFSLLLIPAPFPGEKLNLEQQNAITHYYTSSAVLHEKCFHPHKIFPKFKSMKKQPQPLLFNLHAFMPTWYYDRTASDNADPVQCNVHWQSSALIAMKIPCCFCHVPSHRCPFFPVRQFVT